MKTSTRLPVFALSLCICSLLVCAHAGARRGPAAAAQGGGAVVLAVSKYEASVTAEPVVMLFVFTGTLAAGEVAPCAEGELVWLTDADLESSRGRLVADLVDLLPRLDARRGGDAPLFLATTPSS